jgi:gluconolactonase
VRPGAPVERLADGCRWAEGPVYLDGGVMWSDVPNDRMLRWDEATGAVTVFRAPSAFANGNTLDPEGRLVTCEHGNRRVTRTEPDGTITVLADRFDGKRLNSPNDVVVRSDGAIYFTDPAYGIDNDYEGHKGHSEIGACHVFRIDAESGELSLAADDFDRPNGLAFSLDETRLYVSDTGAPKHMRVLDVADDGSLSGGEVFAECTVGAFDGFRLDDAGRIWTSAGDGVHCYDPDGTLLGKVLVPEGVANVAWGWPKRNRLYICATTSLYAVLLAVNGAKTM